MAGSYTGFSIEPPQPAQTSSWVSRIRTIVECSPQPGLAASRARPVGAEHRAGLGLRL
jgi:hypothetical protein